jgi:hypothetical protein
MLSGDANEKFVALSLPEQGEMNADLLDGFNSG